MGSHSTVPRVQPWSNCGRAYHPISRSPFLGGKSQIPRPVTQILPTHITRRLPSYFTSGKDGLRALDFHVQLGPTWEESHTVADMYSENHAVAMRAILLLLIPMSWTAVLIRCYVRISMLKSFGLDDWLTIPALVSRKDFPGTFN